MAILRPPCNFARGEFPSACTLRDPGEQKARMEKAGIPLDDFDLAIGCCGLAHNLTLVTSNVKHFKRIEGLKIVN